MVNLRTQLLLHPTQLTALAHRIHIPLKYAFFQSDHTLEKLLQTVTFAETKKFPATETHGPARPSDRPVPRGAKKLRATEGDLRSFGVGSEMGFCEDLDSVECAL